MPAATATPAAQPLTLQGQVVPAAVVDPGAFARATRRQTLLQKNIPAFAGLGATDQLSIFQTGIVSQLSIRVVGNVVVTLNAGTVATTARWPYDLVKNCRLAVNGQANLINVGGWDLKAREIMCFPELTDRGISQAIGGASPGTARTQGTLSQANESWGLGSNVTAVAGGTYNFDLAYTVPIAMDQRNLVGALFAQTTSTEIALALDYATSGDLFVLTGAATAVVSAQVIVIATVYTIPQGPNGAIILPDLSAFHSFIKTRFPNPGNGLNEIKLVGQGVGRQLMRLAWRTWNGSPSAPLSVNATNYGQVGWRMGGNDTPELITDGQHQAYMNERLYDAAIGLFQGYVSLDFASEFALRDSIDEGTATELRFLSEIPTGVTLTNPFVEYWQETIFLGTAGA